MQPFSFFYFFLKHIQIATFFFVLATSGSYIHANSTSSITPLTNRPPDFDRKLIRAIHENNLQKVRILITDTKNINDQDFLGYSPLHYAAKVAKEAIVAHLIEAKVLLDQVSVRNGNTPLLLAIKRGHKKIVSLLLAAGANPNIANRQKYSGLQLAIEQNRKDLVQLLLQAGASCNADPSPLLMAIKKHSLPIVKCLLQQKEIVETKDKKGYTELHWAAKENVTAILRALLDSGRFNVNAKGDNGATPLHLIAANKKSKLLKTFLNGPLVEVNVQDSTGSTPLHYAVATNQLKTVNSLLRYPSIDVNIQNHLGQTALHYAVQCQHISIIKKLLIRTDKGVWIKNKAGLTPLELAMQQKNVQIYKLILAHIARLGVD